MDPSTLADSIGRLLAAGDESRLAWTVRSGLVSWRAVLVDAIDRRYLDDEEQSVARDLLAQLDELLGQPWPSAPAAAPPRQAAGAGAGSMLAGLVAAFAADPAVTRWLDEQV